MKNLRINRRALSPVIASVLMILVTMIGMTVLFAFVASYSQGFKEGSGSTVLESLVVEDVWFKESDTVQFTWYNIGKIEVKIAAVYINGTMVSFSPNPLTIEMGKHASFQLILDWNLADSYYLKVVTSRGSGFEGIYSPQGVVV